MSSSVSFGLIALVSFVVFSVLSIRRTIDFIRATSEEHQAVLEGKRPTPLLDTLFLFLFMVAFPICMTLLTGKATFEFLFQQYSAMLSSKVSVSGSIMAPAAAPASSALPESSLVLPGTTAYTFTSTHTIVEGRTNCKWEITHAVNGQPNVANASTVYLTPGEEVYLRTFVNETSGTKAVGGDYCKLDSVPGKTFSVRRTVDANNGDGTVAKWEIVYTFTPDDSKPTATPTSKPRPTSTPASGPWGEDETTDETIGSSSRTAYWVPNGKSYHFSRSCPSLSRSDDIERGTLQEARAAGKKDPCNNCAK